MIDIEQIGKKAKQTTALLNMLETRQKNEILYVVARELEKQAEYILEENQKDILEAKKNGMKESLIDRLSLSKDRIKAMANAVEKIAKLDDPIGKILSGRILENGLEICKKVVPLGVIAIIYESRPNVTVDAFSLCFKTSNAVILKGGKEAIYSNKAIVKVIQEALRQEKMDENVIQLVEDTSRESAKQLMKLNQYVDVLIPRGGANLIKTVVENSTVPVIETGTGNCHIYVDEFADFDKALAIIENAKTQRTGVCNACESLVIHEKIVKQFLPLLVERLEEKQVEIRGDNLACQISTKVKQAEEQDWGKEYLDLIVSVKIVNNIEEAIKHINTYNTKHSEAIITENYENARMFLQQIDAAAVYVNASTRFTDGEEFGFGAEIGISTQKLHARGPMGLTELTTSKYIIYGNGQIRK